MEGSQWVSESVAYENTEGERLLLVEKLEDFEALASDHGLKDHFTDKACCKGSEAGGKRSGVVERLGIADVVGKSENETNTAGFLYLGGTVVRT